MSHLYMAHGDADTDIASAFRRKLQLRGLEVVEIDDSQVPDASWTAETIRAIAGATSFVVFASHDELRSDPRLQYQLGLASSLGKKAIQIAPTRREAGMASSFDPAIQVYYYNPDEITDLDARQLQALGDTFLNDLGAGKQAMQSGAG